MSTEKKNSVRKIKKIYPAEKVNGFTGKLIVSGHNWVKIKSSFLYFNLNFIIDKKELIKLFYKDDKDQMLRTNKFLQVFSSEATL